MLPSQLEMLRQLVAVPSVSSEDPEIDQSNRGVVDLVAQWAADLGFAARIEAVAAAAGKVNLVATRGEGADGFVLSGHTDTVPCNADRWTDDPFALTERDGKLYGLGSADMKGFFAAALHAVARFEPSELRRPITLLGTADEESTMAGARTLADHGESLGRYAIIGEPTSLAPIHKHKCVFHVRIAVGGKAGHASNPAAGLNAIEGVHNIISALHAWHGSLVDRYRDDDFEVPGPSLSLGRIVGGDSFNRIPDACTLLIDMRLLPTMEPEEVLREIEHQVAQALGGGGWPFDVSLRGNHPAFGGPSDDAYRETVETLCGCSAKTALFGTEAPYLARMGLQTLVLGAGDIAVAHQPDEYVTMAEIERATDLYAELIGRYCVDPP